MYAIADLIAAWNNYESEREKVERPNGQFRFELAMTFRAPTSEEYAGCQIVEYGSAEKALSAMQAEGRNIHGHMGNISRHAAAIIAAAMKRS